MIDPVGFQPGIVSLIAARALAVGIAVYAVLTASHTLTAYRKGIEDRGSSLLATWIMVGLAVLMWFDGARLLPAPFSIVVLVFYSVGVTVTLAWSLSNAQRRLDKWKEELERLVDEWAAKALPEAQRDAWMEKRWLQLHPEQQRKTPHLMMGMFVAGYAFLGHLILRAIDAGVPEDLVAGENLGNFRTALDAGWLASGHMAALTALFCVLFLLLPVEMLRLRFPELDYPFKQTITSMLRERERGLFGAHYYIAATLPLAVLWLTSDSRTWDTTLYAVLAMLGVTIFADAASALFGVRWGKKKWPHHPGKSYIGTVGGSAVALLVALPFVGLPMAIVSALVFFLVDVLAPVPFSISDNILNPVALSAAYILLQDHLAPMLPYY